MSSFNCEYCRKAILDTPDGYITGCEHYPLTVKDACKNHTPHPEGFTSWHMWAEQKSKTHKQVKCHGCGLLKVWVKK